ncbi:BlaI/MecI/CopY family transcriptional regulator [Thalassotalea agarivorans]|uniref:Predicted transcriptional regulator n=1 Tax=Thalassotalea agarivorans TaxID=349064 RepID=A0A1I0HPN4_THASX|nr:BlaI/MecI/CopY family transcriptional regulator [Thalassotalea agarivorans]SET85949.1 Predicted transcriptional regulator [Thalassotalea agarivorans]
MAREKNGTKPTEAELTLLNILWEIGPATVRQIHETLSKRQNTGYTTVLKILQIMHEKSLVNRDESNRAHVYSAAESQMITQSSLVKDLIRKAFGGSTSSLVQRAIDDNTTRQEINDIRSMLDEIEKRAN